jgi:hypothetical protein
LLAAAALLVQTPASGHLVGGRVVESAASDPAAEIARGDGGAGRRWVAWKVPARGAMTIGCFSGWTRGKVGDCGCSLASEQRSWGSSDSFPAAGGELEIYAAVKSGRVERLLLASESCPVQAAGESVTVLPSADPARGVALLAGLARGADGATGEDLSEKALAAIAHHSAQKVPAAPSAIAALAREADDPDQRSHALFWLAQTDEPRAARWIREAIARDPDHDVREQGVFALSQLPDATDQLLAVIRESGDRGVRKQALFWLGQSDDPRAIAEIERVLTR